ncbi:OmpA family protein [Sediminitomix flava]|uniref:WD40 repeat protein n=1 Tax=Sediminitomix flava TaxID=379075 RepID=A0A315ZE70_SEDFL|nr:OmpA family protein [Sediminitomix flava]PWJ43118.1 WD40 repeat protein [Sediminitomix flava]
MFINSVMLKKLLFLLGLCLLPLLTYSQAYEFKRLPQGVNSIFTEYAPTLSANGKTMIFQSDRDEGKWKLFETKYEDGNWTSPIPIEAANALVKDGGLIGGPSITYDGNYLYFFAAAEGGMGAGDIYYCERTESGWSEPFNVGEPVNSDSEDTFPSVSADGNQLYFVRLDTVVKENGSVCYDIMESHKQEDGSWGEPRPLPTQINMDCEKAPRIMSDGKTLIFSSKRAGGKGGYDLYISKRNSAGEWSDPQNLSFANTPRDDQFSSVSANGDLLFFIFGEPHSEEIMEEQEGLLKWNYDIYQAVIPEEHRQYKNITIQGYFRDTNGNPVIGGLKVQDAETTEFIFEQECSEDGWYSLVLTEGKNYEINATANGFSDYTFYYDLRDLKQYQEIGKDIELFATANLQLNLYDKEILEQIDANLLVRDAETMEEIATFSKLHKVENNILSLPLGKKYHFTAFKEGFDSAYFTFDLTSTVKYHDFEYDLELPPIMEEFEFNIADVESGGEVDANIVITNKETGEVIEISAEEGKDGKYKTNLRKGGKYNVEVRSPKGYSFFSTKFDTKKKNKKLDVSLHALKANTKLPLKDILFESNSAELVESSYKELKRLVKMMKDNPNIVVELAAHTDDVGKDDYNLELSQDRALSAAAYVSTFGIQGDRIVPRGYGESQPAVENDTEENRALNRRVEMKVLSIIN